MIQQRRKSNSSRANLIISAVFHSVLVLCVFYFAAREGLLGKKLKQLAVTMVKEKKPEPPKEKPPEPKVETPKVDAPKALVPPPQVQASAPPPVDTTPAVAPAAVALPSFEFSDGAHAVESISDPNGIYKALVEHTLRSRWDRPDDIADDNFVAEVELTVDRSGNVEKFRWVSGSGDARWDNSVKAVFAQTKAISRPPPKGFPEQFIVRFDVESVRTENAVQLSSR